jgi:GNAT superfamily N-acetyltransferase
MHPFIRDRDVVTVHPAAKGFPRIGAVAAVRLPGSGHLVLHRIVAKNHEGWLVKGDNCSDADGIVPELAMLGEVRKVERGGKRVGAALGAAGVVVARLNRGRTLNLVRYALSLPKRFASIALSGILGFLQSIPAYRRIGRLCARSIELKPADESLLERIHDRADPWHPYKHRPRPDHVEDWVAMSGERIVGFARFSPECGSGGDRDGAIGRGCIPSLYVYPWYRGLGVGGKLVARLAQSAKAQGCGELRVLVAAGDSSGIALCMKYGFVREAPSVSESDEGRASGIPAGRKITMSLALPD